MKLSTKARYSMRTLIELAISGSGGEPVMIPQLAQKQALSVKYLEALMVALRNAGFVKSVRGKKGGYILSDNWKNLTVYDIVSLFDGPLYLVQCCTDPSVCARVEECETRGLWNDLSLFMQEKMKSVTLLSMVEKAKKSRELSSKKILNGAKR